MQMPDLIGNFEERKSPDFRYPTIDTLTWGSKRHHIPILLEIDVTAAREAIRECKRAGQRIGFTSWVVKCLAQAVNEHKLVQALRKGKRQLVIFDDVDVAMIVEREVNLEGFSENLPMPYIIRRANEKTVSAIHSEIHAAQQSPLADGEVQIGSTQAIGITRIYAMMPEFVRNLLIWRPIFRDPFRVKRMMGTVSVTAMGMLGQSGRTWGIPIGVHPLIVAVGAISKRPGIVDEQIAIREYVGLTVLFDHDVIDGAPVARFIKRLQELMTANFELR